MTTAIPETAVRPPPERRRRPLRQLLSLPVVLLVLTGACLLVPRLALRHTSGNLVYALDDPYIHMAVAARLVNSGTWGINPGEFAGTSSSPLWTLLLAGLFRVAGPGDVLPFALNLVFAWGVVAAWWWALRPVIRSRLVRSLLVLAACVWVYLPSLVMIGMEQTLHVLLSVWAMWLAAGAAAHPRRPAGGRAAVLAAAFALLVATRFEGLFLAGAAAALLAWRRRFGAAAAVAAGAALPVALYAAVSLSHGGAWLPNSVLLKATTSQLGQPGGVWQFLTKLPGTVRPGVRLWALLAVSAGGAYLLWPDRRRPRARLCLYLLWLFAVPAVAHLQFVIFDSLYRYEAYVVAMGVTAAAAAAAYLYAARPGPAGRPARPPAGPGPAGRRRPGWARWLTAAALAAAAVALTAKGLVSIRRSVAAPRNIYDQQVQMARFIREELPGCPVAVNDIGAVSYYGDNYVLDLWGLASRDVFRLRRAGAYDTNAVAALTAAKGVPVAIIYDAWFRPPEAGPPPPAGWEKVEQWTIHGNVVCGDDTVSFYVVDPAARGRVVAALERFAPRLPGSVTRRPLVTPRPPDRTTPDQP